MRIKALTIPLLCLLVATLFFGIPNNISKMTVSAAGTPDAYGNRINALYVQDYNGTDWLMNKNAVTYDGNADPYYPSGNTTAYVWNEYNPASAYAWRVLDAKPVSLWCNVRLNYTLASSSGEAKSFMKIYCNITASGYSLTDQEFTYGSCAQVGTAYWQLYNNYYTWNVTGHPVAGQTYSIVVWYNAYY